MNILITSAGRRVGLVKAFTSSIKKTKLNSKIFITDLNPKKAPSSYFVSKSFKIGLFSDPEYIDNLIDICIKNDVSIIIPTLDHELILLSKYKSKFSKCGIKIIISSLNLITVFRNKETSINFFKNLNIKTPTIYKKHNMVFPVFLKPVDGSNSQGIYKAENINEVKPADIDSDKMMLMEYIDKNKYDEYTVDMYYDKNSNLICAVPRIRLKIVGGESNQGITKKNKVLDFVINKFSFIGGAVGCLTLQLFSNKSNLEDIVAIEINPRFGGGYPFSYNAGADFPNLIIREYLLNDKLSYFDDWKDNCLNIRYENEIIVHD